jgi:hypothetical protein
MSTTEVTQTEHYHIDYADAIGYEFESMDEMVKRESKENSKSIPNYLRSIKKVYREMGIAITNEIAKSNYPIYITELVEYLIDARCNWTLYDRYDSERKLKTGKG